MLLTVPAHRKPSKDGQVYGLYHGTFFCPSNKSMASPDFNWMNNNRQKSAYAHPLKIPNSLRCAEGLDRAYRICNEPMDELEVCETPESAGTINVAR